MNCPHCQAPISVVAGEGESEPDAADVEIARVQATAAERMALLDRGIDPETRRPLKGATDPLTESAEIHAEAEVAIAAEEASAEVASAEVVAAAIEGAADVTAAALEATAEIVAEDDNGDGELSDEIVIEETSEESEETESVPRARRWGF